MCTLKNLSLDLETAREQGIYKTMHIKPGSDNHLNVLFVYVHVPRDKLLKLPQNVWRQKYVPRTRDIIIDFVRGFYIH